ncbi:hypothetical protein mvi_57040 [Methylobacterium indicum]|uniref:Uncharacterized protein n=1 Tax=Methylobacterium indicum TaxID=1775910 RepID=A0A8H9C9H8_9HYPH|nr:hypothetical protein mvi_57040 [Methylobacterium indicum]
MEGGARVAFETGVAFEPGFVRHALVVLASLSREEGARRLSAGRGSYRSNLYDPVLVPPSASRADRCRTAHPGFPADQPRTGCESRTAARSQRNRARPTHSSAHSSTGDWYHSDSDQWPRRNEARLA